MSVGAREYLENQSRRRMGARVLLTMVKCHGFSERHLEKAVEAEAMSCIAHKGFFAIVRIYIF